MQKHEHVSQYLYTEITFCALIWSLSESAGSTIKSIANSHLIGDQVQVHAHTHANSFWVEFTQLRSHKNILQPQVRSLLLRADRICEVNCVCIYGMKAAINNSRSWLCFTFVGRVRSFVVFPFSAKLIFFANFFYHTQPGLISPALSLRGMSMCMHFLAPINCGANAQLLDENETLERAHTGIEPKTPCCGPDRHQKPRIELNLANFHCWHTSQLAPQRNFCGLLFKIWSTKKESVRSWKFQELAFSFLLSHSDLF